jgi:hypothetical protein
MHGTTVKKKKRNYFENQTERDIGDGEQNKHKLKLEKHM